MTSHQNMDNPNLLEVAENIWVAEGACVDFYGFPYPTRCIIIRMTSGMLWVWSPIELNEALKHEIDALGDVAFLVSPNKIHHLFLSQWAVAYPDAKLCGPQSTISKRTDLAIDMTLTNEVPEVWQAEFDQVWLNGSKFLDEIIFFHRASRTAILADFSENFTEAFLSKHWKRWQHVIARWWGITEPFGKAPLELRLTMFKRKEMREARARILAWDPVRVIMAHGRWQKSDGRAFLERSLAWI